MPLLDLFWTTLMIFLWVTWLLLLFRVYGDLFSRRDIGGWAKAAWAVGTLFLPFLGVFLYLITQGRGMADRAIEAVERQRAASDAHIRAVAAEARADEAAGARGPRPSGPAPRDGHDRMQPAHSS